MSVLSLKRAWSSAGSLAPTKASIWKQDKGMLAVGLQKGLSRRDETVRPAIPLSPRTPSLHRRGLLSRAPPPRHPWAAIDVQICIGHYATDGTNEPGAYTLELRDRSVMAFQVIARVLGMPGRSARKRDRPTHREKGSCDNR